LAQVVTAASVVISTREPPTGVFLYTAHHRVVLREIRVIRGKEFGCSGRPRWVMSEGQNART
jgi:hypothetical protein